MTPISLVLHRPLSEKRGDISNYRNVHRDMSISEVYIRSISRGLLALLSWAAATAASQTSVPDQTRYNDPYFSRRPLLPRSFYPRLFLAKTIHPSAKATTLDSWPLASDLSQPPAQPMKTVYKHFHWPINAAIAPGCRFGCCQSREKMNRRSEWAKQHGEILAGCVYWLW